MSSRRGKGDGGLYKRADGKWVGTVELPTTDGTRRRKTVVSRDRGKAAQKLRELQRAVEAGQISSTPQATVEQWLKHWLEDIHKTEVRPKTYKHYEEAIRLHIVPQIGAKRLDKLTPDEVRTMIRTIQGYSTRAAVKAHQALSRALGDAVKEGVLFRNVADAVHRPKHTAKPPDAIGVDAARVLIRHALDNGDPLAARWAAAFFTGARQAELLGLTWDRVDLDAGMMDLSWQLQYLSKVHGCDPAGSCGKQRPGFCPSARWDLPPGFEYRECYKSLAWTRPKTAAGTRLVPIAEPLLVLLRMHWASEEPPPPHSLVWHHPDGRPVSPREDHRAWRVALRAAGFTDPLPNLHAARHTTATLLLKAGVPEQIRMLIMGQSSIAAHRGYVHVDQTLKREAVAQLTRLMIED